MTIDDFSKIYREWALGVRSMVYQRGKGRIQNGELDRFRRLEQKMDEAWIQIKPFDREIFYSEKKELLGDKNGTA